MYNVPSTEDDFGQIFMYPTQENMSHCAHVHAQGCSTIKDKLTTNCLIVTKIL